MKHTTIDVALEFRVARLFDMLNALLTAAV
jgi:hypothetical protein